MDRTHARVGREDCEQGGIEVDKRRKPRRIAGKPTPVPADVQERIDALIGEVGLDVAEVMGLTVATERRRSR